MFLILSLLIKEQDNQCLGYSQSSNRFASNYKTKKIQNDRQDERSNSAHSFILLPPSSQGVERNRRKNISWRKIILEFKSVFFPRVFFLKFWLMNACLNESFWLGRCRSGDEDPPISGLFTIVKATCVLCSNQQYSIIVKVRDHPCLFRSFHWFHGDEM